MAALLCVAPAMSINDLVPLWNACSGQDIFEHSVATVPLAPPRRTAALPACCRCATVQSCSGWCCRSAMINHHYSTTVSSAVVATHQPHNHQHASATQPLPTRHQTNNHQYALAKQPPTRISHTATKPMAQPSVWPFSRPSRQSSTAPTHVSRGRPAC